MMDTKRFSNRSRMKRILLALWDFHYLQILKAKKIRLYGDLNSSIRKLHQKKNVQLKSSTSKLIIKKPAFLESKSIKGKKKELTLGNIKKKYLVSLMRFLDKRQKVKNYTVPTDDKNLKIFKNLKFFRLLKHKKNDKKKVISKFQKFDLQKKKGFRKLLKKNKKSIKKSKIDKNDLDYKKFKEIAADLKKARDKERKTSKAKIWARINYYKRLSALRKQHNFCKNRSKLSLVRIKRFRYRLNIVVKANNVFCTFSYLKNVKRRLLQACNGGTYKLNFSKKTIRFVYNNNIITPFLQKVKMYCFKKKYKKKALFKKQRNWNKKAKPFWFIKRNNAGILVNIVASSRQRKVILNNINYNFRRVPLLIKIHDKKIFNGCRAPKKQRKKRRRMRILKS